MKKSKVWVIWILNESKDQYISWFFINVREITGKLCVVITSWFMIHEPWGRIWEQDKEGEDNILKTL